MKITRQTRVSITFSEAPPVPLARRLQAGFRPFYRLRYDLREHPYGAHRNRTRVSAFPTSNIRRSEDFADSISPNRPHLQPSRMPTTKSDPIRR